ncbi:MAG TPA: hypothetical protein VFS40_07570 [Gemmatimonadales bacterium]|nr:hypothetical protein [Gemmatimonadales bacterium]
MSSAAAEPLVDALPGRLTWRALPGPVRTVARWLTVVQVVGYTVALLFVHHTTGMTPAGAAARYRGSEGAAGGMGDALADPTGAMAMQFRKSYAEMLTSTHNHLLGMAAIFAFSGLMLALCPRPGERWRRVLIAEPFVALLVSFSAMWLMWGVDPRFGWVLVASSTLMALTFYVQSFWILRELGWREPRT